MYLSHPVRRMRDDPADTTVGLIVELDQGAGPTRLRDAVTAADGEVVEALGFDCWLVRVPESAVEELCALRDVARIETDATLERGVDETVEPNEGGGESPVDADRER